MVENTYDVNTQILKTVKELIDVGKFTEAVSELISNDFCDQTIDDKNSLLANCYLSLNLLNDLETLFQEMNFKFETDPNHLTILIRYKIKTKCIQSALQTSDEAISKFPYHPCVLSAAGGTYRIAGKIPEAEKYLKKALQLEPMHFEALINLSIILKEKKELSRAASLLKNAFWIKPFQDNIWGLVIELLSSVNDYDTLFDIIIEMLSYAHEHEGLVNSLFLCAENVNDRETARAGWAKLLKGSPDTAAYKLGYAIFLKNLGELEVAKQIFSSLINLQHYGEKAALFLCEILIVQKDFEHANSLISDSLKRFPQAERFYLLSAQISRICNQPDTALESLTKCTKLHTKDINYHLELSSVLMLLNRDLEALDHIIIANSLNPNNAAVYFASGQVHHKLNHIREAIEAYSACLDLDQYNTAALSALSILYIELGDSHQATNCLKKLLSADNKNCQGYRLISSMNTLTQKNKYFIRMKELERDTSLSDGDRCHLQYGLAKALQDQNKFRESLLAYEYAGRLREQQLEYDFSIDVEHFDNLKDTAFNILNLKPNSECRNIKLAPIFILGMPRSGTTIVEQILSQHSKVAAGGELNTLNEICHDFAIGKNDLKHQDLTKIYHRYASSCLAISGEKFFITDKMPHNFRFIPIIKRVFPYAKIIHCTRSPKDVCWSNFTQYFSANAHGYSYNLRNTVSYYNLYRELMDMWTKQFPEDIHQFSNQQFINNRKVTIQELLAYVGLSAEHACFSPENAVSLVKTASALSVKDNFVKKRGWRDYEELLDPYFLTLN